MELSSSSSIYLCVCGDIEEERDNGMKKDLKVQAALTRGQEAGRGGHTRGSQGVAGAGGYVWCHMHVCVSVIPCGGDVVIC